MIFGYVYCESFSDSFLVKDEFDLDYALSSITKSDGLLDPTYKLCLINLSKKEYDFIDSAVKNRFNSSIMEPLIMACIKYYNRDCATGYYSELHDMTAEEVISDAKDWMML